MNDKRDTDVYLFGTCLVDMLYPDAGMASIELLQNAGINVIFAGHHATETVGVKNLAEHIRKKCNVDTFFCDIPTGL